MKQWLKSHILSFGHAFRGARTLIGTQPHARFHGIATIFVIILGIIFSITKYEWIAIVFAIATVWIAEALNTAIEFIADEITLEKRERIKHAKDVAAFAVLLAALCSIIIGTLVFIPHIL